MSKAFSRGIKAAVAAVAITTQLTPPAAAFCGFYVAKADASLFNKASKVVLAWEDGKTAVTMASDYEGDPKEFAVVIPVPSFLERKDISVVAMKTVDHLDAYTAPRLVEYFDPDPCAEIRDGFLARLKAAPPSAPAAGAVQATRGVVVEATYAVGEYDIQILSASQSDGLVAYLTENGYRIPAGAEDVLESYIKQKTHFFIAKVNLGRMEEAGHRFLRPLQVRYESRKFMLPLRLGTVNAQGPQDLIVLGLTHQGRVETTNYRTVKLPTGMDVPLYVKDEFGRFYTAMFDRAAERQDRRAVFLEYAWDIGWCDPCAAEPLSNDELSALGAPWIGGGAKNRNGGGSDAFVTRLHVRYDAQHFPEDLAFMETRDRENFQGRYVLRHPYAGKTACRAADDYYDALPDRFAQEAETLADLTGWDEKAIKARMEASGQSFTSSAPEHSWIRRWFFNQDR
ncbi:MAG TPA: DUF2330 domain-containing protein [Stellaceae bacterium]|nr:DUF2330 domain-containing protein [Stellaceae bacterium]